MAELLIAKADTFTKMGRYVKRGQPLFADEIDFDKEKSAAHVMDAPSGVDGNAVVEVSAIAPTGPNPKNPQQIPHDAVQTPAGYEMAGATLVGEVTLPEKQRIEVVGIDKDSDAQAKVTEALAKDEAEAPARAAKAKKAEEKKAADAK